MVSMMTCGPDDPPWLATARRELGTKEVRGFKHAPRILQYHAATKLHAKTDEVPWCAAFVCWCLEQVDVASTRSAAAISYESFGQPLESPTLGAIVVLDRTSARNSRARHVAFWVGQSGGNWLLLGGNQGNSVSVKAYAPSRVTAIRWPLV